ncbi:MAG: ATP-binding protein [Coriobacteriia bacterium]|nr:ATP-binding protein [Coriobacteriia bacterium]
MSDRVVLSVPPKGEFAKTVRMTAAALGSRIGMTFDEVDDMRIAAEEAFVYACDRASAGVPVDIAFEMGSDALEMLVGPIPAGAGDGDDREGSRYASFILESVADEFEMLAEEVGSYVRVVKRAGRTEGSRG